MIDISSEMKRSRYQLSLPLVTSACGGSENENEVGDIPAKRLIS